MAFAFVLFSPDCVLSGTTHAALHLMAQRGVRLLAHSWHQLSTQEVATLYASNRSCRPPTILDGLVDDLFGLSPSLCCLATSADKLPDEALHRLLLDIKGPSDPFKCRSNQLRRALGATNKVLNLVHTSDTPADSLREGAIFFPQIPPSANPAPYAPAQALTYECPSQRVTLSGFRILHEVKRRVLISSDRRRDSKALDHSVELERQLIDSQTDQVTLFPQLRSALDQQARAVKTIESAVLRALMYKLISISARTATADIGGSSGSASANLMLKSFGVRLSRWESLVIEVEESMTPHRLIAAQA